MSVKRKRFGKFCPKISFPKFKVEEHESNRAREVVKHESMRILNAHEHGSTDGGTGSCEARASGKFQSTGTRDLSDSFHHGLNFPSSNAFMKHPKETRKITEL